MSRSWSAWLVVAALVALTRDAFAREALPYVDISDEMFLGIILVLVIGAILALVIVVAIAKRGVKVARHIRRERATRPVFPSARVVVDAERNATPENDVPRIP